MEVLCSKNLKPSWYFDLDHKCHNQDEEREAQEMEDVEEEVGSKGVETPSTPRKKARTDTSIKESKPDISIKKSKMDTPIKKGLLKLRPPKNLVTKDKINMALSARIDDILEGDVNGKGEGFVEVTKGRKGRNKKVDTLAPSPRRAPSKGEK